MRLYIIVALEHHGSHLLRGLKSHNGLDMVTLMVVERKHSVRKSRAPYYSVSS